MTETGPTLTSHDEKALKALIAWWEDAGIEMDEPVITARPSAAAGTPSSSAEPRREARRVPPAEPVRAATPEAARAAGFGDAVATGPDAQALAGGADTLDALRTAIDAYEGCALKRTARNTVFARGDRAARLMVIGEAPGREEDDRGEPFLGPTGKLLDRMLAAIGIEREQAYLTHILNWRPPGNRALTQEEITLCLPFIERHIALKKPDMLLLAGGLSAQALLRTNTPITRLRGRWTDYTVRDAKGEATDTTIPALAIFPPSYLIARPGEKRLAWQDLQLVSERLAPTS
ncbi:uracil-DNA glycosylase [Maricaulis sp.]|uniref:uracil-DNA glycosylase n=1 Tax=Maricaulis sp. TaxID=1486257 RepID=UPI0025BBD10F|nr:uracil-DNA glycosylase [Maricaulis sp.]